MPAHFPPPSMLSFAAPIVCVNKASKPRRAGPTSVSPRTPSRAGPAANAPPNLSRDVGYAPRSAAAAGATDEAGAPSPRKRRRQLHHCSRCGREGHNVRACPDAPRDAPGGTLDALHGLAPARSRLREDGWYRQRCGRCGEPGHNARACKVRSTAGCKVCAGKARLPCGACEGRGFLGSALATPGRSVGLVGKKGKRVSSGVLREQVRQVKPSQDTTRNPLSLLSNETQTRKREDVEAQATDEPDIGTDSGLEAAPPRTRRSIGMVGLSTEQKLLAAKARARARNFVSHKALPLSEGLEGGEELVGEPNGGGVKDARLREALARRRQMLAACHSVDERAVVGGWHGGLGASLEGGQDGLDTSRPQLIFEKEGFFSEKTSSDWRDMRFVDMDAEERSEYDRCPRCTGLGFLTCMACSD